MKTVLIACTLRSGSNLLCELLGLYGFGKPTEFFQHERYINSESIRESSIHDLKPMEDLYGEFLALHEGTDWRGAKWNWYQYNTFKKSVSLYSNQTFEDWMPNPVWIRLRRRNKIAQAVSMYIAKKTGVWVAGDNPVVPDSDLEYRFDAIWDEYSDFAVEDDLWTAYLDETKTPYIEVVFEDLISDFASNMRRILRTLDPSKETLVSPDDTLPAGVRNTPLGNPMAKDFISRFTKDLKGRKYLIGPETFALDTLFNKLTASAYQKPFDQFIGQETGPVLIRKLDLRTEVETHGPHEWVERPHFVDGIALRLDPTGCAEIKLPFLRLYLEFMSHSWSGIAEVAVEGNIQTIDLFSLIQARKPWMHSLPETSKQTVTITSSGKKAPLSEGYEVWIQRIWVLGV